MPLLYILLICGGLVGIVFLLRKLIHRNPASKPPKKSQKQIAQDEFANMLETTKIETPKESHK